jgi:hypothetical protein
LTSKVYKSGKKCLVRNYDAANKRIARNEARR